jgi:glycosyltransferase involved in cell wall biosynthesis
MILHFVARLLAKKSSIGSQKSQLSSRAQLRQKDDYLLTIIIPYTKIDSGVLRLANQLSSLNLNSVQVIWVLNSRKDFRNQARILDPFRLSNWLILWEPKRGAGVARNAGTAQAQGEFLWFVDSDDELSIAKFDFLTSQLKKASGHADIVLLGAEDLEFGETVARKPSWFLRPSISSGLHPSEDFHKDLFQITQPAAWNKVFKSSMIRNHQITFSKTRTVNDLAFTYMALASAQNFLILGDDIFYRYHRNRPGSLQTNGLSALNRISALSRLGLHLLMNSLLKKYSLSYLRLVGGTFKLMARSRRKVAKDLGSKCEFETSQSISVVIPMFNSEKYIASAIESVQVQTVRPKEIIVVNDGSTDNSQSIVETLMLSDSTISLITCQNSGLSVARNMGIDVSTSDYVIFLDSDDLLEPRCVEFCTDAIAKTGADIVLFDTAPFVDTEFARNKEVLRHKNRKARYYSRAIDPISLSGVHMLTYLLARDAYLVSACLYAWRRETSSSMGIRFLPSVMMEDNLFTPQLLISSKLAFYGGEILHRRRVRPDSISYRRGVKSTVSQIIILRELDGWSSRNNFPAGVWPERLAVMRLASETLKAFKTLSGEDQRAVLADLGFDSLGSVEGYLKKLIKHRG